MTLLLAVLVASAVLLLPGRGAALPSPSRRGAVGAVDGPPTRRLVPLVLTPRRESHPSAAARAELLALGLRAGLPTDGAERLVHELLGGTGPPGRASTRCEEPASGLLAAARDQSLALGTPLATAVEECARVLAERERATARRAAALAGPRASMWVLTALPVAGPAAASLVGLGPRPSDPLVAASCLTGLALTASGWWWSRALVARAARPRPLPGP